VNLRKYVNDSLMNVSKMKACSVPQIGDNWEWKPFNKVSAAAKAKARASTVLSTTVVSTTVAPATVAPAS